VSHALPAPGLHLRHNNEGKLTAMTYRNTNNGSNQTGASYSHPYDNTMRLAGMTDANNGYAKGRAIPRARPRATPAVPGIYAAWCGSR